MINQRVGADGLRVIASSTAPEGPLNWNPGPSAVRSDENDEVVLGGVVVRVMRSEYGVTLHDTMGWNF